MCDVFGLGDSKKMASVGQYASGAIGQFYQQKEAERETKKAIKKQKAAELAAKQEESMLYGKNRLTMQQGSRTGSLIGGYDTTLTPPPGG